MVAGLFINEHRRRGECGGDSGDFDSERLWRGGFTDGAADRGSGVRGEQGAGGGGGGAAEDGVGRAEAGGGVRGDFGSARVLASARGTVDFGFECGAICHWSMVIGDLPFAV